MQTKLNKNKSKIYISAFYLILLNVLCLSAYAQQNEAQIFSDKPIEKGIFGWIEKVRIAPGGILLHAKLDSGADHSSLSASNITEFERDGKDWVRFDIRNRKGETHTIELRSRRLAKIKRVEGNTQMRPVVRMGLCLGNRFLKVDVNLADRSNFAYPMLIGRNFLAPNVLLDASKTYTVEPHCEEFKANKESKVSK